VSGPAASAPPSLRVAYVLVFLVFAGLGVAVVWPEWAQAWALVAHPYFFGDPPSLLALAASGTGALGSIWMIGRFFRGKGASLPVSGVVLGCAIASWVQAICSEPAARTWAAADKQIVEAAAALREQMGRTLTEKAVPKDDASWTAALANAVKAPSPARAGLRAVPYQVVRSDKQGELPGKLVPASLVVWVSPEGFTFEVIPVGFGKDGQVARLSDLQGAPLVLRSSRDP
jgi:hypothetical protein